MMKIPLTLEYDPEARAAYLRLRAGLAAAPGLFRVGTTPYYLSLADRRNPWCPIRRPTPRRPPGRTSPDSAGSFSFALRILW